MKTACFAVIAVLIAASPALAYDCSDIRAIVKIFGEKKAIQIAKESGATEEQIAQARACLVGWDR